MDKTIMDLVSAKELASFWEEDKSNRIPYLGETLFPARKQRGLNLSWFKGFKGLPIALTPSAYDTKATVRDRIGLTKVETEMPFFREAMIIKETDRQELLAIADSDPAIYDTFLLDIFNDRKNLIEGAMIQPERMRMSLLVDGKIDIEANNVTYSYDYDVDGTWKSTNTATLSGTSAWTDFENSTPLTDIRIMQNKVLSKTGSKPTRAILTSATRDLLLQNVSIKNMLNPLASGVNMVRENELDLLLSTELGLQIQTYDKMFINEAGETKQFYPDNYITLMPPTELGKTNYGTTPEEADLKSANFNGDCAIVELGVAVTTINIPHPVNKETIVSEIVLPSFERMGEVAVIKVA